MIKVNENSPAHWAIRGLGGALLIAVILWVPTMDFAGIGQVNDALLIALAAMSLNLVLGYTGQISIGHSAFFGIGAYATAILVKKYEWSPGWTFFVGAIVAFVIGTIVALPALRIKGIYLALVTLAIAFMFPKFVGWEKLEWLTKGQSGYDSVRYKDLPDWPLVGPFPKGQQGRAEFQFWLSILVVAISYLVIRGVVRSRVGRSLIAVRDNETAAAVMGVHLAQTKTLVFGVSAAICALAGSLSALRSGTVTPESPNIQVVGSVVFLVAMIIGGSATLWGPIVGGFFYFYLERNLGDWSESGPLEFIFGWSKTSPATMIFSILLIVLMFVAPFGVVGLLKRWSRKVVQIVPSPVVGSVDTKAPVAPATAS
ncbi:MAG: branched-chain amino acid ABC transporter permease [Actinomycetota bacterium]|jgi:branched-chain amino acid transport system permease protein